MSSPIIQGYKALSAWKEVCGRSYSLMKLVEVLRNQNFDDIADAVIHIIDRECIIDVIVINVTHHHRYHCQQNVLALPSTWFRWSYFANQFVTVEILNHCQVFVELISLELLSQLIQVVFIFKWLSSNLNYYCYCYYYYYYYYYYYFIWIVILLRSFSYSTSVIHSFAIPNASMPSDRKKETKNEWNSKDTDCSCCMHGNVWDTNVCYRMCGNVISWQHSQQMWLTIIILNCWLYLINLCF